MKMTMKNRNMIEENNCCVICGEIIPEGRQVCRKCEIAAELKKTMAEKLKGDKENDEKHFTE